MSKKYKLVIPEMIPRGSAFLAWCLRHNEIYNDDWKDKGYSFNDIPKDWLQEIKEPETFDEWFQGRFNSGVSLQGIFTQDDLRACHEWTKENERLKHEPKQRFEEWVNKMYPGFDTHERAQARLIWDASAKNRGYDA